MNCAAVMLIVNDENKILSIQRKYNKTKWGLPGGKKELNESFKDAAIRESFEETGIIVTNCFLLYTHEEPSEVEGGETFYTECYCATSWEGEISSPEGLMPQWLTEDQLSSKEMGAFPEYNLNALNNYKMYNANKLCFNSVPNRFAI